MKGNGTGDTSQKSARSLGRPSTPEFPVDSLSLDEMLMLGQEASRALKNQSVELALQSAVRRLQNEWADSKPEETRKREGLYWTIQGLQVYYQSLTGSVAQAQAIHDRQKQQQFQQEQAYNDLT